MNIVRSIAFACAALALGFSSAQAAPDKIRIGDGALEGATSDGVTVFKGIPFAAPPVGNLRWRAPASVKHWSGAKGGAFGPSCLQPSRGAFAQTTSEDCLYLNVWTPAQTGAEKLPVMVWIYGGAFVSGSGSYPWYDGTRFAKQGVVLVTLNYRLGRFGFFAHPALTRENPKGPLGNYGLMDQIAALKWVKKNISKFGGDPAQVTIFGESAGGMSVNYLMVSPAAKGLFSKAISESGFGRTQLGPIRGDARSAEATGAAWAQSQGVADDAPASKLRALPADVVAALPLSGGLAGVEAAARPMVDGVIITEQPAAAFAAGHQEKVPFLLGGNSYEASLIHPSPDRILPLLGARKDQIVALYGGPANLNQVVADLTTDRLVTEPNRYLASQMEKVGAPAYIYYFSYVPEAMRQNSLGLPHGGEIPFVFGNLRDGATPADRAISDAATHYWVAFAKTGNPGNAGGPTWPAYTAATDQWMEFSADGPVVRTAFRKPQLDFQALVSSIGGGVMASAAPAAAAH